MRSKDPDQLSLIVIPPNDPTDIIHRKESPKESQELLDQSREHLCSQAILVFNMMMDRLQLTTIGAAAGIIYRGEKHHIGDLRTRISDFKKAKIHHQKDRIPGERAKVYYMREEDREMNRINFPYLLYEQKKPD